MCDWIAVKQRVPEDRHLVLVWGESGFVPITTPWKSSFLGTTRFNPRRDGGHFDIEHRHWSSLYWCRVTHWAEIVGPAGGAPMAKE